MKLWRFKISDAEAIAKKFDCQAVMVLCVERDGTLTTVTYGENKRKCDVIGKWAAGLSNYALTIVPFQTVFGWGNGGHPKPLSDEQRAEIVRKIGSPERFKQIFGVELT